MMPPSRLLAAVLTATLALCATGAHAQSSTLVSGATETQRLSFEAGPNFVSLRVVPADPSLEALFGDVLDRVLLIKDAEGMVFAPSYEIRTLTSWDWTEALFVSALEPFVLEVEGRRIEDESELALGAGWNWLPTFLETPATLEDAFGSILPALTHADDGGDAVYPEDGSSPALAEIEPGRGYRVRLSEPATLVYAKPPPPGPVTVATIEDALLLVGLQPGQTVFVEDPVRGGEFVVTESECAPDGGTCFVPEEVTTETAAAGIGDSQTLYGGGGIAFESLRLYYGPETQDYVSASDLHGHGSRREGRPVFDSETGRLSVPWGLRTHAGSLTGSNTLRVAYRYATSGLRLERTVPPLVLEGRPTTDYVRPEWWGARPYPADWTPSTLAPASPGSRPPGIVIGDPVYDATAEIATAANAATALYRATNREHYVVFGGMYGYAGVIETQDGTAFKGERDGVRDGQGLRVLKGAPWHYWALMDGTDPAYRKNPTAQDVLNPGAFVVVRHGRRSVSDRVVDLEIDGNLVENNYVFSAPYRAASGSSSYSGGSVVDALLQNTAHWNGFVASHQSRDNIIGSRTRLQNVHIHDVGGNLWLSNQPVHFGGSRDVLLGNSARNHVMYGIPTVEGTTIDRVTIYGFYWKGAVEMYQGHYRDVVVRDLIQPPALYTGDRLEGLIGHRNDAPDPALFGTTGQTKHYFGEETLIEGLDLTFDDAVPYVGAIGYHRGPRTVTGVVARNLTDGPAPLVSDASGIKSDPARDAFTLEDVALEGPWHGLTTTALRHTVRRVTSDQTVGVVGDAYDALYRKENGHGPGDFVQVYDRVQYPAADLQAVVKAVMPSGSSLSVTITGAPVGDPARPVYDAGRFLRLGSGEGTVTLDVADVDFVDLPDPEVGVTLTGVRDLSSP